jgi:CHAT domain-containing protein
MPHARHPEPPDRTVTIPSPRILIVTQPNTPKLNLPLPSTRIEAKKIMHHFQSGVKHLDHADATVNDVLKEMAQHDWVHLACHGTQTSLRSSLDPTKSAFLLYDGRLELVRLMGASRTRAELAVLSACQTAQGDENLPEEAVHLAAGMLAAGFKSVVATMWSIKDADGPVFSDVLYAALKKQHEGKTEGEELRVAYALHEAVQRLKEHVGEDKFARWLPFVHFGI